MREKHITLGLIVQGLLCFSHLETLTILAQNYNIVITEEIVI